MPHTPTVVRVELPTPDMLIVNTRDRGTLLYADHRVTDDSIAALLSVIRSHIDLHPDDWHPNPFPHHRGRVSAAG